MSTIGSRGGVVAFGVLAGAVALGCGIGIKRELEMPPQQIVFDDVCGLQDYFDTVAVGKAQAPEIVSTSEIESTEGKRVSGGRTRFRFVTPFQLATLKRVLDENWKRVPDEVAKATPGTAVEIEVLWSEKAGVRRVVTDREAEMAVGPTIWELPYHTCLSDLLFGAPLYRTRREVLGLPPLPTPPPAPSARRPAVDAGAGDAGR